MSGDTCTFPGTARKIRFGRDKPGKKKGRYEKMDGKFCIVRAKDAGVFFGKVIYRVHDEVLMREVRRLWYWGGACSCSQLAVDGTKAPEECKFTVTVPEMEIIGVIEVIPCSEAAIKSIQAVDVWKR